VYDRAGRGWSESATGPQDGLQIATDLHTLLDRAHIPGPYVLAGHSFGGLYVLAFAAGYPDQIAGLVLLDSTAPTSPTTRPNNAGSYDTLGRLSTLGIHGGVSPGCPPSLDRARFTTTADETPCPTDRRAAHRWLGADVVDARPRRTCRGWSGSASMSLIHRPAVPALTP